MVLRRAPTPAQCALQSSHECRISARLSHGGTQVEEVGSGTVPDVEHERADLRERADLFGREAERYDKSRPTYPPALIDEVVGPSPDALSVLDVGCGTGIASRQMAGRGHVQALGMEPPPPSLLLCSSFSAVSDGTRPRSAVPIGRSGTRCPRKPDYPSFELTTDASGPGKKRSSFPVSPHRTR
jgi:hypothetical protein